VAERSAGILLYRVTADGPEVLLVHPGGPFWAKRDAGAWSIPKGELAAGEDPRAGAIREFAEELGSSPPEGELADLGECRQRGGKVVIAFAVEGDLDSGRVHSNTFELEWPPRSGRCQEFPEIDRAGWFPLEQAREKLLGAQTAFIDRLVEHLATRPGPGTGPPALPDHEDTP
jgi:predicted NUDIX family NTP pyrophosphohydrolase